MSKHNILFPTKKVLESYKKSRLESLQKFFFCTQKNFLEDDFISFFQVSRSFITISHGERWQFFRSFLKTDGFLASNNDNFLSSNSNISFLDFRKKSFLFYFDGNSTFTFHQFFSLSSSYLFSCIFEHFPFFSFKFLFFLHFIPSKNQNLFC